MDTSGIKYLYEFLISNVQKKKSLFSIKLILNLRITTSCSKIWSNILFSEFPTIQQQWIPYSITNSNAYVCFTKYVVFLSLKVYLKFRKCYRNTFISRT